MPDVSDESCALTKLNGNQYEKREEMQHIKDSHRRELTSIRQQQLRITTKRSESVDGYATKDVVSYDETTSDERLRLAASRRVWEMAACQLTSGQSGLHAFLPFI
ncbi:unnamed protein product [Angiostrongylus costaricensis]|uniref:Uncharacterized protein n=1 Tax=Angiostrongylus costaricensis TaxID=334426 RepID=A0A0R3PXS9_ANGCS|nr:unnamed protein product [Angiostrongylus costaricensis]